MQLISRSLVSNDLLQMLTCIHYVNYKYMVSYEYTVEINIGNPTYKFVF